MSTQHEHRRKCSPLDKEIERPRNLNERLGYWDGDLDRYGVLDAIIRELNDSKTHNTACCPTPPMSSELPVIP